jgi:predicted nucleotidyltransferase
MRNATADALRPLPAGYAGLFARVLQAAESDDRIRTVWLGGSVGRGVADAGSDLDVVIAVTPGEFDAFAMAWRDWLADVTPTVLARALPRLPGSFYSVTPDCLRLDVVVERAGSARPSDLARRLLVLDKDDLAWGAHPPGDTDPREVTHVVGPNPARLAELVGEFLRQMAIFPAAVVARQDWLLGVVGVQGAQLLLYELFVEANQPLPPMGVKQWSAKLTPRQRQICAGLPAPTASRTAVLDAMRATAATFRREAEAVFAARRVPWPTDFDQAVRRYWQAELGWTGSTDNG